MQPANSTIAQLFTKPGTHAGMCADIAASHPLIFNDETLGERIEGKWLTLLADYRIVDSGAECIQSEYLPSLDDSNSMIYKTSEITRMPIGINEETKEYDFKTFLSGQTSTLVDIAEGAPEEELKYMAKGSYNLFSYKPTNKFTQFLNLEDFFVEDVLKDGIMGTMTCIQTAMPLPLPMIKERLQEASKIAGKQVTKEEVFTDEMLYGQMTVMYEISIRDDVLDLFNGNTEQIKQLRDTIEQGLELEKVKMEVQKPTGKKEDDVEVEVIDINRLQLVNQADEVCDVMRTLV